MEEGRKKYLIYTPDDELKKLYREMEHEKIEAMSRATSMTPEEEAIKQIVVREKERPNVTAFRMEDEDRLEYLKLRVDEVVGTVTERRKFLERRIRELEEAIKKREKLHEDILKDIDEDIKDKESLMRKMSKAEDIRDVMLDISALKSQKRREEVQFWRDITQLKNELAVLQEEYEITKKISDILEE